MACNNCYNGCSETVSDKCVKYTGLDIPALGIENGDSLASVEQAIFNFLVPVLNGTGVKPIVDDEYICEIIQNYLPNCSECDGFTLNEILTAIVRTACRLKENVDSIFATLTILNSNYNIGCLTGVTSSTDTHDVLQATINKVCQIAIDLSNLEDYVDATFTTPADVNTLIQQYVSTQPQFTKYYNRMVPYEAVPYFGPLSNFNGAGVGLGDWEKIYLCNGDNGTPDLRGRVVVGATNIPGGGPMNPVVNPGGFNPSYSLNTTAGSNSVTLDVSQMPVHSHNINTTVDFEDPGHTHNLKVNTDAVGGGFPAFESSVAEGNFSTQTSTTGITLNVTCTAANSGGNQAHSNIQPSHAAYYIMYIP
jgi:microcystin-dependent protein